MNRESERGDPASTGWLLCRVAAVRIALPLEQIVETMRPLPVEFLPGAPDFVRGISIVRGIPVPVVDVGTLIGVSGQPESMAPGRMVSMRNGERSLALLVDSVEEVRGTLPSASDAPAPLIRHVAQNTLSAIGALDAALLLFLETSRVVPDSVFDKIGGPG